MQRSFSVFSGLCLVLMGGLFLLGNLVLPIFGIDVHWFQAWRLWPLMVVGLGLWLLVMTAFALKRRGFGALFIPALPILTTGAILLFASVTNFYSVWVFAWPLIILALALGFLFAALAMRVVWLGIPAIILGVNGAMLAFCAWTGMWSSWAVLWPIEPAAVGLVLMLVSAKVRSWVVAAVGLLFFEGAWMGVLASIGARFLGVWAFRLIGPGLLITAGAALLAWAVLGRRQERLG